MTSRGFMTVTEPDPLYRPMSTGATGTRGEETCAKLQAECEAACRARPGLLEYLEFLDETDPDLEGEDLDKDEKPRLRRLLNGLRQDHARRGEMLRDWERIWGQHGRRVR